jgi:hypothetical protein
MKKSFIRLTGFWIVIVLMISVGSLSGWTQEVGQQPPTEGNASKQEAGAARPNLSSSSLGPKSVEDFSTPALTSGTALGSIEGSQMELDDDDARFTREIVRVEWRVGDPIDLYIIKPVGVKNPPVILYLYDYPKETDQYHNREFCRLLTKDGFAAVGFVPALSGERYHDRPMKEWFVSELPEALATSAHDVQMVLNYMASREDVDTNRVGMFGDGSGASIAILTAAVDPRIKTLDLQDPWGDWPDWIKESKRIPEGERPAYLKPEWLAGVEPLDPVKWLPQLKTPKVRIQFVKDITVTPADVQQKIEAAVPPNAQVVHYDNIAAFHAALAGGTGFDWIKKEMQFSVVPDYSAVGHEQQNRSNTTKDVRQ